MWPIGNARIADHNVTRLQNSLADIYTLLDQITPANQKTLSWRPRIELFHYPLGAAVLLVLAYHVVMWLLSVGAFHRRDSEAGA